MTLREVQMQQAIIRLTRFWILSLLAVCASAADVPLSIDAQLLYGTWVSSERVPDQGSVETRFVINRDATFSGTLMVNGDQVWGYSGTWSLDGNHITWHYTSSSLVLLVEDQAEVDELLSVGNDTLSYRSGRHGTIHTLRRVE